MHARLTSGFLLALGFADLAVLNLVIAPRLKEQAAMVVAESVVEGACHGEASPPPAAPAAGSAPASAPIAMPAAPPEAAEIEAAPDVVFEIGSALVPRSRAADVRGVAEALRGRADRKLLVRGHADRLGLPGSNLALSGQRADAVLRLLAHYGAPADRVMVEAAGTAEPASSSDTPEGWARNRRVQLLWR
jgi:outer membrane protein OmpA-like peptidoglycan-associated protein